MPLRLLLGELMRLHGACDQHDAAAERLVIFQHLDDGVPGARNSRRLDRSALDVALRVQAAADAHGLTLRELARLVLRNGRSDVVERNLTVAPAAAVLGEAKGVVPVALPRLA